MTNITLNQTIPVGQTWIFEIENGEQYNIESSSPLLLYQLTSNNLFITADMKAPNGATITLTNDPVVIRYTLDKTGIIEVPTNPITIYKGSTATLPQDFTSSDAISFNKTPFDVYVKGIKRYIWIAIPKSLSVTNVVDTTLNQEQLNMFNVEERGDFKVYIFNTNLNNPDTTYKFTIS